MADNFNLRQFLSENKLTKNAKLIKEEVSEATPPTMQAGFDSVAAQSKQSENLRRIANELFPEFGGDLENLKPLSPEQRKAVYYELHKQSQLSEAGEQYPDDIEWIQSSNSPSDSYDPDSPEEVDMLGWSESTDRYFEGTAFTEDLGDVDIVEEIPQEEAQEKELSKHFTKNNINENKMTSREKYLTRLVENALGLEVTEDDNVDYTMGNQDDPNQLPNPASQISIPEGEEMVQREPLPKYESIEKLMQEIEHGTNKAMYEYKMNRMKEIAEMLEAKVGALEEGEHAEHIDKKAVNQMRKDIAALRKGEEKLRKEFDRKFNKKEKGAAPKKEAEAEKPTLQEGTFDLRKFLVENKITANSKLTQE